MCTLKYNNVLYTMKKLYTLTCKLVLMVVECFAMVCYVFSVSGTVCIIYSVHMSKLPGPVIEEFRKGNHVMRHQRGILNGLWSDLYIETTFMRYGHSPGGIVGIKLQPSTLKRWALSLHICAQLKKDVMSLSDHNVHHTITTHKEESATRTMTDSGDQKEACYLHRPVRPI